MQKLEFHDKINLPTDKFIVIIRNEKIYYTGGSCTRVYEMFKCNTASVNFLDFNIKDTDVVYVCPTPETYYRYIATGKCLNEFMLGKTGNNQSRAEQVKQFFKSNPEWFVGRECMGARYEVVLKNDVLRCVTPKGEDYCIASEFGDSVPHFKTNNKYEFYRWLNKITD